MYIKRTAYFLIFFFLSSFGLTIALKNRGREGNVASLREAVSNAFDALTEVKQAIPKYDVIDEESIDFGDVAMDKDTAEKFVEEIDQLEDIILNKEDAVMDSIRKKKNEDTSGRNVMLSEKRSKDINIKDIVKKRNKDIDMKDMMKKRSEDIEMKQMLKKRSQDLDMKDMINSKSDEDKQLDRSFDLLLDILKKSIGERNRGTKFEDYLMSNFLNEERMTKDEKELKSITGTKKETRKVDVRTAQVKKSNGNQTKKEVKKCEGSKKECSGHDGINTNEKKISEKKETKKEKKTERFNNDVKSSPLKKKSIKSNPSVHHSTKSKRPSWSKKQSLSDENYDQEIKDLVGTILKRREETKREKLKLALADIFHMLDNKRVSNTHK